MSAGPGVCGSVTGSPVAARSISTSCSEPEPTLSPRPAALWAASEEEEELYFYHCTFLKPSCSNLTTGLVLNCCCHCICIRCTVNKRSFILTENNKIEKKEEGPFPFSFI